MTTTLEVTYVGAVDDEIDARICLSAGGMELGKSYRPSKRLRNIQFRFDSEAKAQAAADRVSRLPYNLQTFTRESPT